MKNYLKYVHSVLILAILPLQGGFFRDCFTKSLVMLPVSAYAKSGFDIGIATALICGAIFIYNGQGAQEHIPQTDEETERLVYRGNDPEVQAAWEGYYGCYGTYPYCSVSRQNLNKVNLCTSDYATAFRCEYQKCLNKFALDVAQRNGQPEDTTLANISNYMFNRKALYEQCLLQCLQNLRRKLSTEDDEYLVEYERLIQAQRIGQFVGAVSFFSERFQSIRNILIGLEIFNEKIVKNEYSRFVGARE